MFRLKRATAQRTHRPRSRQRRIIVVALLASGVLLACGQKGPLWVPGHAKDTPWPIRSPEAARPPNASGGSGAPPDGSADGAAAPDASAAPAANPAAIPADVKPAASSADGADTPAAPVPAANAVGTNRPANTP